jgi:hypothetical protein
MIVARICPERHFVAIVRRKWGAIEAIPRPPQPAKIFQNPGTKSAA